MSTRKSTDRAELLQGTLDVLILRTLAQGRHHGHGIALAIRAKLEEALLVETGSVYPALQRLEDRGWIRAGWGVADANRRARFYELTREGRKQLAREESKWRALARAVGLVLAPEPAGG